jgi:hypothetical protein
VRTEPFPEVLVPALAEQVQVDRAERRQVAVGVVVRVRVAAVGDREPVVRDDLPGHRAGEDPAVVHQRQRVLLALDHRGHRVGVRPERADRHTVAARVGAEDRVRVAVLAARDLAVLARQLVGHSHFSTSRWMLPSGMVIHAGRLRAS